MTPPADSWSYTDPESTSSDGWSYEDPTPTTATPSASAGEWTFEDPPSAPAMEHTAADYGALAMQGSASAGEGIGWVGEQAARLTGAAIDSVYIPGVSDLNRMVEMATGTPLTGHAQNAWGALKGAAADAKQSWSNDLSPAMQQSMAREFVTTDSQGNLALGDAWTDPHAYLGPLVQSLPAMALSMGGGGLATKGLIRAGMGEGVAGAIGFGGGEGIIAAGQGGADMASIIQGLPEETLRQSPGYQELIAKGYQPDEARTMLADHLSLQIGAVTGGATAALGAPLGALYSRMMGSNASAVARNRLIAMVEGAAGEGAQETLQSGAEQTLQNVGRQQAGENVALTAGLPEAMSKGGMVGAAAGSGFAGGLYNNQKTAPPETAPPVTPVDPATNPDAAAQTDALLQGGFENQPETDALPVNAEEAATAETELADMLAAAETAQTEGAAAPSPIDSRRTMRLGESVQATHSVGGREVTVSRPKVIAETIAGVEARQISTGKNTSRFAFDVEEERGTAEHRNVAQHVARLDDIEYNELAADEKYKRLRKDYGHDIAIAMGVSDVYRAEMDRRIDDMPIEEYQKWIDESTIEAKRRGFAKVKQTGATVQNGRRLDIVTGYGGSGKSSVIVKKLMREFGSFELDSDAVKEQWYEKRKEGGLLANAYHRHSGVVTEEHLLPDLMSDGSNIVLPKIGKEAAGLQKLIDRAKAAGYTVNIHYVEVSQGTSLQRLVSRWHQEKRLVSPENTERIKDGQIGEAFDTMLAEGGVDGYTHWNNDVPFGHPPRLIRANNSDALIAGTPNKQAGGEVGAAPVAGDTRRRGLSRHNQGAGVREEGASGEEAVTSAKPTTTTEPSPAIAAGSTGKTTKIVTDAGTEIEAEYALVDLADLTASHDADLRANPAFPAEIQPRDRDRAGYEQSINGIVGRFDPERVGESRLANHGAPIVNSGGVVEAGNGRVIAIDRLYNRGKADSYRQWLTDNADKYGHDPAKVTSLKRPVLVRVRKTDVDPVKFAREANAEEQAAMSPFERAKMDADLITLVGFVASESGAINSSANMTWIQNLIGRMPKQEVSALVTAGGLLNKAGEERITNAILVRAYGPEPFVEKMIEETDSNIKTIQSALLTMAPRALELANDIIKGNVYKEFDGFFADFAEAALRFSQLRREGQKVQDYLSQTALFGEDSAVVKRYVQYFSEARSKKSIVDDLHNYIDGVYRLGSPSQTGLFGREDIPTAQELFYQLKGKHDAKGQTTQTGIFEESTGGASVPSDSRSKRQASEGTRTETGPSEPVAFSVKQKSAASPTTTLGAADGVHTRPGRDAGQSRAESRSRDLPQALQNVGATTVADSALTDEQNKARDLGDALGATVRFYQLRQSAGIRGAWVGGNVWINVESDNPVTWVMGHEVIHAMAENHPDLYSRLIVELRNHVTDFDSFWDNQSAAYKSALSKIYGADNGFERLPIDKAWEELAADYAGDKLLDPAFLQKLAAKDPSLAQQIVDLVKEIIDKIRRAIQGGDYTSPYLADAEALHDVLAEVLADMSRRDRDTPVDKKIAWEAQRELKQILSATVPDIKLSAARVAPVTDAMAEKVATVAAYDIIVGRVKDEAAFEERMRSIFGKNYATYQPYMAGWYTRAKDIAAGNADTEIRSARATIRAAKESGAKLSKKLDKEIGRLKEAAAIKAMTAWAEGKEVAGLRDELVTYLKTFPRTVRGYVEMLAKVKNVRTVADLETAKRRVDQLGEDYKKRVVKTAIKTLLDRTKVKSVNGRPQGKFTPEIQAALDALREAFKLKPAELQMEIDADLAETIKAGTDLDYKLAARHEAARKMIALDTMSADEAHQLYKDIEGLMHEGRVAKGMKDLIRKTAVEGKISRSIETVSGGKPAKQNPFGTGSLDKDTVRERLRRFVVTLGAGMMDIDGLLDMASAKDQSTGAFESSLNKDFDVFPAILKEKEVVQKLDGLYRAKYNEVYELTSDLAAAKHARENNKPVSLGEFRGVDGEVSPLQMTKAMMRKRWMEWLDPALRESMSRSMGDVEGIMDAIEKQLTPADKEFAVWQVHHFYRDAYGELNAVYRDMNGVDLPQNDHYSPIKREGYTSETERGEILQDYRERASVSKGMMISRVKNDLVIMAQSDVGAAQRHIAQVAHYVAWAEPVRTMRAVFSNPHVKFQIEKSAGKKVHERIVDFVDAFARGDLYAIKLGNNIDRLRINFTRAALAIKPSIFIKQLTSFPAYLEHVPALYFGRYLLDFALHPLASIKVMGDSVYIKARSEGVSRDIKDAMRSEEYNELQRTKSLWNALMMNIRLGDIGAVYAGGWAVYKYNLDVLGKSHKEALFAFEKATDVTQQSAEIARMPHLWRASPLTKLATMFLSSPMQYFQREAAAVRGLLTGRGDRLLHLKVIAIHQVILPLLFQFASSLAMPGDDDDETAKEYYRAMILGPLVGIPIAGKLLERFTRTMLGIDYFRWDSGGAYSPLFSIADDVDYVGKYVEKFFDGTMTEKENERFVRHLADVFGAMTGTPAKQAVDATIGADRIFEGKEAEGALILLGYSPHTAASVANGNEETKPTWQEKLKRQQRERRKAWGKKE